MRLLLALLLVAYTNAYLTGYNTLDSGTIIDEQVLLRTEFRGYFWSDPNLGGTNYQEAGKINGGSIAIPYFNNNAGKTVADLFGNQENIERFCISQQSYKTIGKTTQRVYYTTDWTFQFYAFLNYQGFQDYDLIFYDDIQKEHIVTFEHRANTGNIQIGKLNRHSWQRSEFENPSGFDSLVNKITNHQRILFYLEFKVAHITVPTTLTTFPESTSVNSIIPVISSDTTLLETIGKTSVVVEKVLPFNTPSPNNLDMSIDEQVEDGFIHMNMNWVLSIFVPVAFTLIIFIVYYVRRRHRIGQSATVERELEIT